MSNYFSLIHDEHLKGNNFSTLPLPDINILYWRYRLLSKFKHVLLWHYLKPLVIILMLSIFPLNFSLLYLDKSPPDIFIAVFTVRWWGSVRDSISGCLYHACVMHAYNINPYCFYFAVKSSSRFVHSHQAKTVSQLVDILFWFMV